MIEQVEVFMRKAFPEEMKNRDEGKCPFCGKVIDPEKEFRDELSKREFKISGLCQKCQDEVFTEPEEEW